MSSNPKSLPHLEFKAAHWLRQHAIPLKSTHPSSTHSDLNPLQNLLKPAKVISLSKNR